MRQYRWQIIALVFSGILFILALSTRFTGQPDVVPGATITPSVLEEAIDATTITPQTVATATLPPSEPTLPPQVNQSAIGTDNVSTFTEAQVGTIQRLNPLFVSDNEAEKTITSLMFEGLVKINDFGEPVPSLARNWYISGDGLEYVFTLREDILWQDGIPFTSDDVIYTMDTLRDENFPGDSALKTFWKTIETEQLGPHLVRFRLTQPLASFASALTIGILPEHALRGTAAQDLLTHPFNLSPIGTGPYQLEALRSQDGEHINMVDLQASPNYLARQDVAGLNIQRMRFQLFNTFDEAYAALTNQQVDGLATDDMAQRAQLLNVPGTEAYTAIAPELGVLIFNWDEPDDVRFFQEQRVRWALQRSLDRAPAIYSQLPNLAIVAEGPLSPTSWAYLPDLVWPGVDMAQAQSLIENISMLRQQPEAPATEEGEAAPEATAETPQSEGEPSGPIYEFTILVPENEALVAIATNYAQQWGAINLQVNVESAPAETYQQRLDAGDFDAAIVELPLNADPDVYAYWHVGQAPDGLNYGAAADDRISELLERARRDANGLNRIQLYHDFQSLFVERAIAIPLYHPLFTYAVSLDVANVQLGFIGTSTDRFRTIADWQLR